ncbi:NapH/MauN family ferredoxin-type protein [Hippea jasoniae]|uniref:NapH/MauN family ferredoxin-type protein n=1 Tax=Hippea jasoniae TaxID=944479 RepID=UPI0005532E5E|nr:NapH/MauN family ferredoxin-type protein [Hippea jasoniae]
MAKKEIKRGNFYELFINTRKIRPGRISYRCIRWFSIILITATFAFSYKWALDFLAGSLNGSRLMSFFLIDLYTGLEYILAHKALTFNALVGLLTILLFYFVVGGRTFCGWVCPYNLLAEIGEIIHEYLRKKGIIKKRRMYSEKIRYAFWVIFLLIPFITGAIFFESFNPLDIINRSFIYGPTVMVFWALLLLLVEVFYARRFWCKYVCPTGTTYGMVGKVGMLRVKFDLDNCTHCGNCYKVCIEPTLLTDALKEAKTKEDRKAFVKGLACINCARCIDVCAYDALKFDLRYIEKIL